MKGLNPFYLVGFVQAYSGPLLSLIKRYLILAVPRQWFVSADFAQRHR